jgi:hypothetical protein
MDTAAALESAPVEAKAPEEWALMMDKGVATVEDAEEVAATMAEATMEVVNEVVHPPHDEAAAQAMMAEEPLATMEAIADDGEAEDSKMSYKRLSEEKIAKLDALGFVWNLRIKRVEDHWESMFNQLLDFKEKYGDCLVPSRYDENIKVRAVSMGCG